MNLQKPQKDSNSHILLTGATGFIGKHILQQLKVDKFPVYTLARKWADINCDLSSGTDIDILSSHEIDTVIHSAAKITKHIDEINNGIDYINTNLIGTINLVSNIKNINHFIFLSTLDVYGIPKYLPIDENHPTNPHTYYGMSKLSAEKFLEIFCYKNKINLLILRLSHVYGSGEHVVKIISKTMVRIKKDKLPIIYGDGSELRDYIHVNDVANLVCKAIKNKTTGIVNIASGKSRSILSIINDIISISCKNTTPVYEERRNNRIDYSFNIDKMIKLFGEFPQKDFMSGLKEQYGDLF